MTLVLALSIVVIAIAAVYNWLETRRINQLRNQRKQARAMANKQRSRRIQNATRYNENVYLAESRRYDCKRYLH